MKPGRPQNMLAVLITVVDLKPHIIVLDKQYITDNNGMFISAQIPTLQTEEGSNPEIRESQVHEIAVPHNG